MPNPFSRIVPGAEIYPDWTILDNKPEMALLVTKIFAVWASIERELNFLLVRVLGLGPSSRPQAALAMFKVLTAQHLQMKVLDAAARAQLSKSLSDRLSRQLHRELRRLFGGTQCRWKCTEAKESLRLPAHEPAHLGSGRADAGT
jgi:hypothetical protein